MNDLLTHPMGEPKNRALMSSSGPVAVDTFSGRIHVEWNPQAAVTPLGQLPYFIEYLKLAGLFDARWTSPRLIFGFTRNFLQSEIQPVFRSLRKFLVNPNLCATISPTGEKCGLGFRCGKVGDDRVSVWHSEGCKCSF